MGKKKTAKPARVAPKSVKSNARKPAIPNKILRDFLEEKCELSKLKDVSKLESGFLWENGGIERYRINVWRTTYETNQVCPSIKIIYSYFTFYYPDEQTVVDKTALPDPEAIKIY